MQSSNTSLQYRYPNELLRVEKTNLYSAHSLLSLFLFIRCNVNRTNLTEIKYSFFQMIMRSFTSVFLLFSRTCIVFLFDLFLFFCVCSILCYLLSFWINVPEVCVWVCVCVCVCVGGGCLATNLVPMLELRIDESTLYSVVRISVNATLFAVLSEKLSLFAALLILTTRYNE